MVAAHDSRTAPATLVGCERERQRLRTQFDAARAGHGSLVLISGEAGVGKTALAEDLCHHATTRGACAIAGHCYDLIDTPPYGPWDEAVARYRAFLLPVPDAPAIPLPDVATATNQSALFAAFAAFLTAAAADRPLVVLLEDCHWADAASLDLLRFLARAVGTLSVLLLVTFRGDELTLRHPLSTLVPLLEREARAVRLEVRRLDRGAVGELVGARYALDAGDAERLVAWLDERASGNAFFTMQLLHALVEGQVLREEGAHWELGDLASVGVPLRLRQVIEARALRLNDEAHRLLTVAALIGHDVPFSLWQAVTESEEETLFAVAEAAIAARLIEATVDGAGVRFAHALVREALVEGMLPFHRRRLHRQIGEALAGLVNPDPDAVAYHFQRAGDGRATEWLVHAGVGAERAHAWLMAAERYGAAADLVTAPEEASRRAGLLLHAALLRRYMDIGDSAALTDEAMLLSEGRDAGLVAFGTFVRGWLQSMTKFGAPDGIAPMVAGIAALEALSASERERLAAGVGYEVEVTHCRAILVHRLTLLGRFREARELGERLRSEEFTPLVASSPFEDPQGGMAFSLGIVFAAFGDPDAAREAWTRASASFRASGQFAIHGTCAMRRLGWLHTTYTTDDLAEREQLTAEITEAHAAAVAMTADLSRTARFLTAFLEGEWDYITDTPLTVIGGISLTMRVEHAQLARARGEHARAWEHIRAVFPQGPRDLPGNEYRLTLWLIRVAIALALDQKDLATAQTWLAAHDRWQAWSGCVPWRAEGELLWARYDRMRGHQAQAQERAARALTLASAPRQPLALLAAHRTLGAFDTAAGDHTAAHAHLDTALALADACRAPYERALILLALADLHIATERTAAARGTLDEVRTICVPLGAQPVLDRANALAARLETAPPPPALPAGLTEREAEVLRLVTQGLTNTQMAERLFIARRTVEFHLSSIYRKLGISSRAAATRFALEHDLS